MEGISNKTIVNFFENETDHDLKKLCQCFSVKLRNKIYFLSRDGDWKKSLSVYNNEYRLKQ